jgi:hypothetical protein
MAWATGFLIAPLVGTRLLVLGAPALWLACAALWGRRHWPNWPSRTGSHS